MGWWRLLALLILLAAGTLTSACARRLVGSPIQVENIPKIVVGQTTRSEVLRLFGAPYTVDTRGDQEVVTYVYGREVVWTVGVYSEKRDRADVLTIFLDRGVVTEHSYSEGVATPDIYRQPRGRPPL